MTKIHKGKKTVKKEERSLSEKYQRPERHIKRVDFQRIEEAPLDKFEKSIQRKIATGSSPLDLLLKDESQRIIFAATQEIINSSALSSSELKCIRLTLKGLRPFEIAKQLKLDHHTVSTFLTRALNKMKTHLNANKAAYQELKNWLAL